MSGRTGTGIHFHTPQVKDSKDKCFRSVGEKEVGKEMLGEEKVESKEVEIAGHVVVEVREGEEGVPLNEKALLSLLSCFSFLPRAARR